MSKPAKPSPHHCERHPDTMLVDVLMPDGVTIARACPRCRKLELVDVVRQVYREEQSA